MIDLGYGIPRWICKICLQKFRSDMHFPHNGEPFTTGNVCQKCNDNIVVPYRIFLMLGGEEE